MGEEKKKKKKKNILLSLGMVMSDTQQEAAGYQK